MNFPTFGYWVRRRRMALDLTQAVLARQVGCAAITIKKIEHNERHPSRVMAQRLAECLSIPAEERQFFVQSAIGDYLSKPVPLGVRPQASYPSEEEGPRGLKSVPDFADRFIGRQSELAWLDNQLGRVLSGEGKIVFISGGAGLGKTALLQEFLRRSVETHPDLIPSGGICSAYTGKGDPFLPFRDVLGFLTGAVDSHWITNASNRCGQRVWQALPQTLQVLAESAPYLLDVLVSGKDLLARASVAAPGGAGWLAQLQSAAAQYRSAVSVPGQDMVFSQFTNLLLHLARRHPLLIVLDDLHWADDASLSLLFHIVRHISNSRIFILGAFRRDELISSSASQPHLLESILSEFTRAYGEITLDLASADQAQGKRFVEAFLNGLPNHFRPSFFQALYRQTAGHPLFTVEFVREMQARGDLVMDGSGFWHEAENLDWGTLPARVEAVIAQRFNRLDPELIQLLKVACVEGEQFNAEVVAHVLGVSEQAVLHNFSQQLAKRYQLVQARGELKISTRILSPYTFRHVLFQQYLRDQLDPGERRILHASVAEALEFLYHQNLDLVAAQLAYHYQEARQAHKAVQYLALAGRRALQLSGYEEAVHLLEQGLELLINLPSNSQPVRLHLNLLLNLGEAQYRSGLIAESLITYQKTAALAREHGEIEAMANAVLGYEESRWRFNFPCETSRQLLEETLRMVGESDHSLSTRLTIGRVRTLMPDISQAEFTTLRGQAIEMARRLDDPVILYDALYLIPWGNRNPQDSGLRLAALSEMILLAESIGDLSRQKEAMNYRTLEHLELGDLQAVPDDDTVQKELLAKTHFPLYYFHKLGQVTLEIMRGNFSQAEINAQIVQQMGNRMKIESADGIFGIQMFTLRREQGRLKEILSLVEFFVAQHSRSGTWMPGLALIYTDLDMRANAGQVFDFLAEKNFAAIPNDALWLTCIAYLAEVCAYLQDRARAAHLYMLLAPYSGRTHVTGYFGVCYGAVDRYLGLLAVTLERWDDAERLFKNAMDMNTRLEAWPWLAHTQYAYAEMLLKRGTSGDQAQAEILLDSAREIAISLGMERLIEKVNKTKGE